jgi:Arc/MetJ family transcription regulator
MTKTLIDIDDDELARAQQALQTTTKKDTVNRALSEATALAARRRDLERLIEGRLADLGDAKIMNKAWRR